MLTAILAFIASVASLVAQSTAPPVSPLVLNNGPCLDSAYAVPRALEGSDVVRIDKVISTATMIDGQIIGYLYTRQDGSTILGQRSQRYMSAADSDAINQVLSSTHLPGATVTSFPPVRKYGVKTNYQEAFPVRLPDAALAALAIRLVPCVTWPAGSPLPSAVP